MITRLAMGLLIAAVLLAGLAVAAPANAANVDVFNLTSCHLSDGCGTATQFGTVTLTQSGTSVNFDVVLNSGNRFVETGSGGQELFLFNDSLSGSTITNITATLNGAPVTITGGLSGFTNISPAVHADGTGDFTASVECTQANPGGACDGGSTPNINDLHFTVTNATLTQLEVKNPLVNGSGGNFFVADILCGQTGCTGLTGPVDANTGPIPPLQGVPEPASLLLLGSGLVGLGLWGRKRLKNIIEG